MPLLCSCSSLLSHIHSILSVRGYPHSQFHSLEPMLMISIICNGAGLMWWLVAYLVLAELLITPWNSSVPFWPETAWQNKWVSKNMLLMYPKCHYQSCYYRNKSHFVLTLNCLFCWGLINMETFSLNKFFKTPQQQPKHTTNGSQSHHDLF